MKLADLSPTKRREVLLAELGRALLAIREPTKTATLVKAIRKSIGETDDTWVAKQLAKALDAKYPEGHPARVATGETFVRYGKVMPRYVWNPVAFHSTGRIARASKPNIQSIPVRTVEGAKIRAALIAEQEAEDWLDQPAAGPEPTFLED